MAALCCHSVSSSWHEDIRHTRSRAKSAFVDPCCEPSRQKALRKPPKRPVFLCTTSRRAATCQRAPCSLWRTYVRMFTAAAAPTPGAFKKTNQPKNKQTTTPNRWHRLEAVLESVRKCKFQRVVLLYPWWITSCHRGGTKDAAAGTKDPAPSVSPG